MSNSVEVQPYRTMDEESTSLRNRIDGAIFVSAFLYVWISITPFENLAAPPVPRAALNQLTGLAIAGILFVLAIRHKLLPLLLRPRLPLFLLFGWLAVCSLFGDLPVTALQRLIFTGLLCFIMSVLVLLPKDKQQFSRLMAIFSVILIASCYFGVIFLRARAVHQAYDLSEPQLAGDWRGIFNHKNAAAPAMIILVIIGLYLRSAWSTLWGTLITLAAAIFLYKTNGKTATMLLPVTLVLVWWMERHARRALLMIVGFLAFLNIFAVGSAFSPGIRKAVESAGIDATFTGRTDIWQLSLETFAKSPLFGQGFQSFWNSKELLAQADVSANWAVIASHAHNGYIESLLNGGIPAFILVIIWLVIIPARNFAKAVENGADIDLNRLFSRIWVYALLSSCLESNFFTGTGSIWSSLLVAVYCLHHQAHDTLSERMEKVS